MIRLDPIAIPLQGTNLIEASAGTGKTYTLTTLYLRLLLESRLDIGKILVVTYTNAATAELRDRIRRRLRAAISILQGGGETQDETLRALLQSHLDEDAGLAERLLTVALHGFDNASIFTIHGFCQRMLQDHAFESRVSFDAELMSDQTALRDEVVRDFLASRLYDASPDLVRFLSGKLTPAILGNLARKVQSHPHVEVLPKKAEAVAENTPSDDAGPERLLSLQQEFAVYVGEEMRRRMEQANTQSFDDLLQRLDEALDGPGGTFLAHEIRDRFPAALIDEFQDTDPTQYRIFRRAYHETGATLFLIGDPKQAIYAFRGADVFTYIDAKHDAEHTHTLDTNWRSDQGLLRAVNTLFGRAKLPFVFEDIPFVALEPAPDAADRLAVDTTAAPLQILFFRGERRHRDKKTGRRINKTAGRPAVYVAVAREVARFLRSGATIDGRPVEPADIAILCRTNDQARCVQEQLRLCRVPSALQGDSSVFDSPEAKELERVLRPVAEPGDFSAARAALATSMIGKRAHELLALQEDERQWNEWAGRFETWHETWLRHGFLPAFRRLLDDCSVPKNLLALIDGERRLTNLLHLGELLHRAAVEQRLGPVALVEWLALVQQDEVARREVGGEAAQIRLESDARAAKLTTIHKSKGLEYPIVYCPFMWDASGLHKEDGRHLLFHDPDDGNRPKLDLGSDASAKHKKLAEREALAESLRLLYVALTRAKHRCSVVWGPFNQIEKSALGYLLHQVDGPSGKKDLIQTTEARIKRLDDAEICADIERLVGEAAGAIEMTELPTLGEASYLEDQGDPGDLQCRQVVRRLELTSRTSSFSRLVSVEHPLSQPAEEGIDHDEAHVIEEGIPAGDADAVALNEFPAGARPGQLLHDILEHLDFPAADTSESRTMVAATLAQYGVDETWAEPLHAAIGDALATPLDEASDPLCLQSVTLDRRLNELQFLFPVARAWSADTARLTSGALATAFAREGRRPIPDDYATRIRDLGFAPLAGYLTGFIDLVFEHEGLWYLVDYKSNHLGPRPDDYAPTRLVEDMARHHYFLQYHLYVVALHRYLTLRLADYDYDRHFGGVYYLFLRGMSVRHPPRRGVFYDRPPRALIEALSECMAQPGEGRSSG